MTRLLRLLLLLSLAPLAFAQSADLSLTMTMPSTAVYSSSFGARVNGQFTVTNPGPSIAQNVTIDFGTHVSATDYLAGFTCGLTNGRYLCTAVSMAPGTVSGSFLATWMQVPPNTVETTTVAVSSSSPADPDTTNNSVSANTTVIWQADVQLTDLAVPSPAPPGMYVAVDAYYSNVGPSLATDVKITISVPPGTTYQGYFADSWFKCTQPAIGSQGDLVCTAATVGNVQGGFFVEAVVQVDPSAVPGTVITIPATMTSSDALKSPQSLSGELTVATPADMTATISSPSSVLSTDTVTSTVTVTNKGPGNGLNAGASLVLTGGGQVTGVSGPAGWNCSHGFTSGGCSMASFPPGTATFTFTWVPTVKSGTITQKATASTIVDTNYSDNIVTTTTTVTAPPQATLKLTVTASPDTVHSGDQLTYTAQIANTSNVDAQGVYLLWGSLPGTVVATTCGTTSVAQCSFPTIAAGTTQTVTRTIHVDAGAGTVLSTTMSVGASNVIYDAASNTATVSKTVAENVIGTSAEVTESITADKTAVVTGERLTQTFTVTNNGPDAATGVVLNVLLPNGAASPTLSSTFASCSGTAPIHCVAPSLPAGASLSIAITFQAPGTPGSFETDSNISWENSGWSTASTYLQVIAPPATPAPARRRAARH